MKKYFSFSELYLWERSRDEYVKRYIDGIEEPEDSPRKLGKIVHHALENPNFRWEKSLIEGGFEDKVPIVQTVLGKLALKRLGNPEFTLVTRAKWGDQLLCQFDDFDPKNAYLNEYKTYNSDGEGPEKWFPSIVAQHKQISFYNWALTLSRHRNFRAVFLYAIDLSRGTVKSFETQRGPRDNKFIESWAYNIISEIKKAGLWEKRLGREDRIKKTMTPLFPDEAVENELIGG